MNNTPIGIIVGAAGAGKDTVAQLIAKHVNSALVAQADPLKRLGHKAFGFSERQLWGPSSARNAWDEDFATTKGWDETAARLFRQGQAKTWLDMYARSPHKLTALMNWYLDLAKAHGFQLDPHDAGDLEDGRRFSPTIDQLFPETEKPPLTPRHMLQTLGTEFGRQNLAPDVWSKVAISDAFALLGGGYLYDRVDRLVPNKNYAGAELVLITDGRFRNELLNVYRAGGFSILVENPAGPDDLNAGVANHQSETELRKIPRSWHKYVVINDKSKGLEVLEDQVKILARTIQTDGAVGFYT